MTLTLMALVLFCGGACVMVPAVNLIRVRLSPAVARMTKRTRSFLSFTVVVSLLYELAFLAVYGTDHLSPFPKPLGDVFWVSAGLCGIIAGIAGAMVLSGLMRVISMFQIILGLGLLGLLVLAVGITSM